MVDRLDGERVVSSYSPTTRNLPNLVRNSVLAVRLLLRERPSLIVSAGAGVAVPFFVAAWLLRIPTVFIEVYDRVDTPTMTGRLCGPFTTRRIVQWQSQLEFYPDAQPRGAPPVKPLVVALAGTDHHPFDRLVEWVDAAAARRPDVRFLVQHGSATHAATRWPRGRPFLAHDRLVALLAEASVAICHGGPGTIMDAREAGHVPLCVPRDPDWASTSTGTSSGSRPWSAGRSGVVRHVTTVESFHAELGRALEQSSSPASAVLATQARDTHGPGSQPSWTSSS